MKTSEAPMKNSSAISDDDFRRLSELVKTGAISAITIDTNIVVRNQCSFINGVVGQMQQFAGTDVQVLLSEVVLREAKGHVAKAHSDRFDKLHALRRQARFYLQESSAMDDLCDEIDDLPSPKELADAECERFLIDTRAELIPYDNTKVAELLDMYFAAKPPFEVSGEKKSEFPDAIALLGLQSWADETGNGILVVSEDQGWKHFCESCGAGRLHCVTSLAAALEIVNDTHEHRKFAAEARFDAMIRQFTDRDGHLFKLVVGKFEEILREHIKVTATSRFALVHEVAAIDYRDLLVSVSPRPGVIRNDARALVFIVHLNLYVGAWTRFSFSHQEDSELIGQGLFFSGIRDEASVLLTSEGGGINAEVLVDIKNLNLDYGEVEIGRAEGNELDAHEIWPGWVRASL